MTKQKTKKKLVLAAHTLRELTVRDLTLAELAAVAGGMRPRTEMTYCSCV